MKFIRFFSLLISCFFAFTQSSFAQNATNIPPLAPPFFDQNTPDWAIEMYSDRPNVRIVDRLFRQYFEANPFEKTVDTRNYKHWRRYISRYNLVQNDGSIRVPTDAERETETADWLRRKAELDAEIQRSPTSKWAQIGPFENTGSGTTFTNRQSCQVALSQCLGDLNVLYTASQNGKLFKTTNHGDTWEVIGENYFFEGDTWTEQCLAVHPTDPNTVYYGSGSKIWKTTDGGTTWATMLAVAGLEPNCILINPSNTNIVFISSEKGIYKSTNGTSFLNVRAGISWDLRFKTNDPNTIFGLCQNGSKTDFYKSTDGGTVWNPNIAGWFANAQTEDGGGRMTVSTGNPNLIYCFVLGRVAGDLAAKPIVGIAKSIDAGANWTRPINFDTQQGINGGQGYYDLDIEVSDANDNLLLLGTQSTWKTTDGFATVVSGPSGQHADPQEYHFNGPNDFWVASDGGIDLYDNLLTSRVPRAKGISGTEFWGFDQGWNEDTRAGSYYHNGTSAFRQNYPNNQFLSTGGGEPASAYISVGNAAKVWFQGPGGKIFPPVITGATTDFSYTKYPNETYWANDERGEIVPHPLYFNTHLLGLNNVLWKTTDGGINFTTQYTFGANLLSLVTSIEICRANPQIMYVFQLIEAGGSYTSGKLWKTTDGGTTFNEIVQPTGAPTSDGCFIAVNPSDVNNFWIAYNKTTSTNKVFKTTDGGTNWTNITGNALNGLIPREIIHIGGTNGGVYLMTRHSVFYRNNTHTEWQAFGNSLPAKLEANYMRPFYKEGKMRLATVCRGLWSVDFYENPAAPIAQPTVDKSTSGCWRDTFYFEDYSMLNHTNASWSWSFSPAPQFVSSASARNPKVVFGAAGNYNITLTVTDASGVSSSKTVNSMVVLDNLNACGLTEGPEKSLLINGTSNYATTTTPVPLGITNTITIAAWIKPTGTQVANAAIIFSGNDGATGLNFRTANQLGYHWADGSGSYNWSSGPTIPANVWSHVAMVIKADSAIFYLNGVKYARVAAHAAVDFVGAFNFGNDRNNTARTMLGEMDEVRFYNRALSQAEIRELRHLTFAGGDASLKAYFKFNENTGAAYDRIGFAHASLAGTATRTTEVAPFEPGQSARLSVTTGGAKNFAAANLTLTFPSAGSFPNGELCVSQLNNAPDSLPTNFESIGKKYWVVNNHGNNGTFTSLTEIKFSGINVNSSVASRYKLYKRSSNEHLNNWTLVDAADAVTTGTTGSITFNTGLVLTSFSQFVILEKGVRVSPKVLLQANFNTSTSLMNDQLRAANLIPTNEPYTALNFGQVEGGGENTTSSVFSAAGNDAIVDWVFVELRDKNNPATKLFTRSALLQRDGDVVDLDGISPVHFANATADDYFLAIKHRNALGIRSAAVLNLTENTTIFDATLAQNTAYQNPAITANAAMVSLGSGKFGLWRANANGDGFINVVDGALAKNQSTPNQGNIYLGTDVNMDGSTNVIDPALTKIQSTPNKTAHF